jgi:hypothetical protein
MLLKRQHQAIRIVWRPAISAWVSSFALHVAAVAILCHVAFRVDPWPLSHNQTGSVIQIKTVQGVGTGSADLMSPVTMVADRQGTSLRIMIESAVAHAQGRPIEAGLEKLRQMGGQLQQISTVANVRALSRQIKSVFGRDSLNAPPTELTFGFDFATAQFQDIIETEPGVFRALLIDQFGNLYETDINAETAQQVQRLLVLMEEYPLLRAVYEDIVCSLLNQLGGTGPQA